MSLPSGYKQLEYIQSTGTQYIDTLFNPTQNTQLVLDAAFLGSAGTNVAGVRNNSIDTTNRFGIISFGSASKLGAFFRDSSIQVVTFDNNRHLYDLSKDGLVFDGTSYGGANTGSFACTYSLTLFAWNNGADGVTCNLCKVYSCQIYDNGTLVRDFVPCQTAGGEIGLWDDVNSVFYGNVGTGTFVGGGYTSLKTGDILNYAYTGAVQSVTLPKGVYKLEVWGAQGGYRSSSSRGGKGGYSVGTITITQPTNIFIYVGGSGNTGGTSGGFNGGGARRTYKGGGGASDMRIGQDSLYARVIVAGGGGSDGASNKTGMYGGGTTGGSTTENYGTGGYGGTQTGVSSSSWQTTTHSTSTTSQSGAYAGFGFGGNGIYRSNGYGGAGGGGWYGGSGSYPDTSGDDDRGGGGGSGFVWTGSNAPSGYLLGSEYYLTNASTIAGNASMPNTSGGTETGHTGNGYARITAIKVGSLNLPVNIGGTWKDANEVFVNIGGTWKTVEAAFVNIGGTWKELG